MAADDSDDKKPEVDPWADILSENVGGGDGLGEVDDASAFNFLDDDDDAAPADPFAIEAREADATGTEFPADLNLSFGESDLAANELAADPVPTAERMGAELAADELAADELAADLTGEGLGEELAQELFAEADLEAESLAAESAADAPPLSVFAPEESAVGEPSPSTIEIGTGLSGIRLDDAEAANEQAFAQAAVDGDDDEPRESGGTFDFGSEATGNTDESGFFASAAAEAEEESGFGEGAFDAGALAVEEDAETTGEELFAAAAPVVAAAVTTPGRVTAAKAAPKKKGGIGSTIGVVLGGLMSIPIVLGILIGLMWMGWPDTLGLRKSMPAALSFLLPPKKPSGLARLPAVAPDAIPDAGGSALDGALDDLAATNPADTDMAANDAAGGDAAGGERPAPVDALAAAGALPGIDALPDDGPPSPAPSDDPFDSPAAPSSDREGDADAPQANAVAAAGTRPAVPPIDDFDAAVLGGETVPARPQPLPVVEPEPLDMTGLDAAVAAADEACAAVAALDDFSARGSRRQLIDWYRSLARVAEELAILERVAADAARPLAGAPPQVVDLHATIAADDRLVDQLARLGPMWLVFDKRESDGVMLVGEFGSARAAGPWWLSRVSHAGQDGEHHELTVVSRSEPSAVAGEPVLITGVVVGGDVVWAADCRSARDPKPAGTEPDDVFGSPEF